MDDKALSIYVGSKIKEFRLLRSLTQKELASKIGMGDTTIVNYEKGIRSPKKNTLFKIAEILDIPIDDFFPATRTTTPPTTLTAIQETVEKLEEPRRVIVLDTAKTQLEKQQAESKVIDLHEPLYEYRVYEKASAGVGYGYTGDRTYDTVYFDEDIPHDFATWISGDSMEPTYLNGEVALIRDSGYDYDGAIYLIDWDGQSYIKKAYKEKDGLRLVSLNKKYADKFAAWEEEPRIIGKVIGSFAPVERWGGYGQKSQTTI